MVYSRALIVFVLSFFVQLNAEDVLYRGTADDGTYSEVRRSEAPIPGGAAHSISTFSTRVLGGGTPLVASTLGGGPQNRMLGLDNFGFPPKPLGLSSISSFPQNYVNSMGFPGFGGGFPPVPIMPRLRRVPEDLSDAQGPTYPSGSNAVQGFDGYPGLL